MCEFNVCTGSPGIELQAQMWVLETEGGGTLQEQEVPLTSEPLSVPVLNFFLQCFAVFIV